MVFDYEISKKIMQKCSPDHICFTTVLGGYKNLSSRSNIVLVVKCHPTRSKAQPKMSYIICPSSVFLLTPKLVSHVAHERLIWR